MTQPRCNPIHLSLILKLLSAQMSNIVLRLDHYRVVRNVQWLFYNCASLYKKTELKVKNYISECVNDKFFMQNQVIMSKRFLVMCTNLFGFLVSVVKNKKIPNSDFIFFQNGGNVCKVRLLRLSDNIMLYQFHLAWSIYLNRTGRKNAFLIHMFINLSVFNFHDAWHVQFIYFPIYEFLQEAHLA